MTGALPTPVWLSDPPGSPAALQASVLRLASAGASAGLLCHLLEPAAVVHGWTSADGRVAGAEVGAATAVAAQLHAALTTALARVQAHAEAWSLVERRLAVLRQRQQDQFAAAHARLAALGGPFAALSGDVLPPAAAAVVDEVVADDTARAAEHRALLAELADDASRSAAVLGEAAGALAGGGSRRPAAAVTARLAVALPGWGVPAMTRLGSDAAAALTAPGELEAVTAAAVRYTPYVGVPAFAEALARGLGATGATYLLSLLGSLAGTGAGDQVAALLAGAFGAAPPVRPPLVAADPGGGADVVAIGMGTVLAAPGAGAALAATWGRALLEREAVQGAGAVARTTSTLPDPVKAAVEVLRRTGDRGACAELLASAGAWAAALARNWSDGGSALAAVIGLAAAAPAGAPAVRAGLELLGAGLAPGSREPALDDRQLAPDVRDALGGLVAAQAGAVVTELRRAVGAGTAGAGTAATDGAADARLRDCGCCWPSRGRTGP